MAAAAVTNAMAGEIAVMTLSQLDFIASHNQKQTETFMKGSNKKRDDSRQLWNLQRDVTETETGAISAYLDSSSVRLVSRRYGNSDSW